MEFIYYNTMNTKGQPTHDCTHVALIVTLATAAHYTSSAFVVPVDCFCCMCHEYSSFKGCLKKTKKKQKEQKKLLQSLLFHLYALGL